MLKSFFNRFPSIMRDVPKSSNIQEAAAKLDAIMDAGVKPSDVLQSVDKQLGGQQSRLDVRNTDHDMTMVSYAAFNMLRTWQAKYTDDMPQDKDDPARDFWLARLWRDEPILAGAIYSMSAKMTALRWIITGRRLQARRAAILLASAGHMGGYDWAGFQASSAQDFYTTNRGVFWETPRMQPTIVGALSGLQHIDALCCNLTGNTQYPMLYSSETTGQRLRFKPNEFIHFTSLPSSREYNIGAGFCAVDRAWSAAKLLMAIHSYDREKLNNLPPEGVASVTGLTTQEFKDAVALWKEMRKQDNSLTFPQVLWLIGSQPSVNVGVTFTGFSQAPEGFDRQTIVTHYVSTLAMCFGVDAREFWPVSSGALGTGSESEIQHLKAKGKGHGEYISITERQINNELDAETNFRYDTQDIEEDMQAAAVAKAWVDAYYPLYTGTPAGKSKASPSGKRNTEAVPNPQEIEQTSAAGQSMSAAGPAIPPGMAGQGGQQGPQGPEQVLTKDEFKRLLADRGVLPEWMMNDERVAVMDTEIHLAKEGHPDDFTEVYWEKGALKERRLPAYTLASNVNVLDDVLVAGKRAARMTARANNDPQMAQVLSTGIDIELASMYKMMVAIKEAVLERKIRGAPIAKNELTRGTKITASTLKRELARWRDDPKLAKLVPTGDELDKLLEALS